MLLDDILERNREWVDHHPPHPLPPVSTVQLAVVACYDPRLDSLLLPALGLQQGDVFLLRSAGALLQPGSTTMRSLALAIYMFGVTEILIVGHAACRMAAFDTAAFIEEFRRRGVPREAFGDESLRNWVGAIPSPRQGVLLSVAAVREAPFVPKDVRVAGVVLEETTGRLDVVARPDQPVETTTAILAQRPVATTGGGHTSAADSATEGADARRAAASEGAASRAAATQGTGGAGGDVLAAADAMTAADAAAAAKSGGAQRTGKRARAGRSAPPPPPRPTAAASGAAASSAAATAPPANPRVAETRSLLQAVDGFLTTIESKEQWKKDVENLRTELERRRDPRQRLELLDAFARRLGGESREVAESFARLRREIAAAGADPVTELLSVFHHLGRRR